MSRASLNYRDRAELAQGGFDPDVPQCGFYSWRFQGTMAAGIRIHMAGPVDPVTGEDLTETRGLRICADINGEPVWPWSVWPKCAGDPITQREYLFRRRQQEWGREHDPDGPHANPTRKVNLLTAPIPNF